uniref:Ycf21 n=1 Tax=Laurencia catarinensis TaxID=197326 RepID=UPI0028D44F58|nr:Ycf21 [Laurencia catarinensis]WMP12417.1 Ycf21 [Laurencia catarinensis]
MNFYIQTFNKFYPISVLQITKVKKIKNKKLNININKLNIRLAGQGSFTKSFIYLNSKIIDINRLQIDNNNRTIESRRMRCIWIKQNIYTLLALSRSLWNTIRSKTNRLGTISLLPIGIYITNKGLNIHRITHELYYGYCKKMELPISYIDTKILCGRKSTLYYRTLQYITIQEFIAEI